MTIIERRDAILESLRCQFRAKVESVQLVNVYAVGEQTPLQAFLLDLANNLAQALADDDDFGSGMAACRAADGVD